MSDLIEITITTAPVTGLVGGCSVCNHTTRSDAQCPKCKPLVTDVCLGCLTRYPDGVPASVPPPGPPGGGPTGP